MAFQMITNDQNRAQKAICFFDFTYSSYIVSLVLAWIVLKTKGVLNVIIAMPCVFD